MNPYRARCSFCGHIWYGESRQKAWDYMMRHCNSIENHPSVEPFLVPVTVARYWLWRFSPDKGRLEQLERHAVPDAMRRLRNIPLA